MSKFIIEKGIPVPSIGSNRGDLSKTISSLEIGDSFVHPNRKIQTSLSTYGKKLGVKLSSRKIGDSALRIWRTA